MFIETTSSAVVVHLCSRMRLFSLLPFPAANRACSTAHTQKATALTLPMCGLHGQEWEAGDGILKAVIKHHNSLGARLAQATQANIEHKA